MLDTKKFVLPLLVGLLNVSCSLVDHNRSKDTQFVTKAEVEPYLTQWQNSQDSITRLGEMESDLALLIRLVASQADLESLPSELRGDLHRVTHAVAEKESDAQPQPFVQLAIFIQKSRADSYLAQFKKRHPKLATVMTYQVSGFTKGNIEYYRALAGPFSYKRDAEKVCYILQAMSQSCQVLIE
ncbi:hypothetical protein PSECIP111951_03513 [Pseudoalteromonas holothuriae]|uniref:SPOR domain-containing protein n=1 Tax=Pseudoalteromonas holothuriae TaxID=2963714 RepID=A0ABM9GMB5_9GAMM|nr:SPOR domain-containing protein [Pseudoalteromonas sp. CIP111951]CAH9066155.1 hypothetical protein PSECIP111951_03513 [Pseudoalteromonas sp. CIP111951]